jgi:hypothetical protein
MTTGELNLEALLKERPTADIARLRSRGVMVGAVGVVGAVAGFVTQESSLFWQSYLIGYVFWLGITLGSLALLMVQYLSGGGWGMLARRVFEASTRNIWLMVVLFLPIAVKLPVLYVWVRPELVTDLELREQIHDKAQYLNTTFFYARAVLFFVVWGGLTFVLNRWSKQQDDSAPRLPGPMDRRFRVLAGPGLVLYFITITFMAVDWIMSMQPQFTSTIFGILTIGGQGLSTLAFTILVLSALARFKPVSDVAQPGHFHDLGKLMLAFVMLWAYFNVSQLLIIWSANLPEEIPWYIARIQGPWTWVAVLILLGHFALPFLLLLSRDLKRHSGLLAKVAIFVLVMRVIDVIWNVGPIFRKDFTIHWLDFCAVAAIGGVWLFFFFGSLAGRALVPANDPYFKEALAHGGH